MRLLVMSCSNRKIKEPALMPAWERYDGPAYWVVNLSKREVACPPTTHIIISAKFGVIEPELRIPDYNVKMTPFLAKIQAGRIREALQLKVDAVKPSEILVFAGPHYQAAVMPPTSWAGDVPVSAVWGQLGFRYQLLRAWYRGEVACLNGGFKVLKSGLIIKEGEPFSLPRTEVPKAKRGE